MSNVVTNGYRRRAGASNVLRSQDLRSAQLVGDRSRFEDGEKTPSIGMIDSCLRVDLIEHRLRIAEERQGLEEIGQRATVFLRMREREEEPALKQAGCREVLALMADVPLVVLVETARRRRRR